MSSKIGEEDFVRMFRLEGSGLPEIAAARLRQMNLSYRPSSKEELAEYVLEFLKPMDRKLTPRCKEENLSAFERGWTENLELLKLAKPEGLEAALKPKYFRGAKFFRYNNEVIVPENPHIEYETFVIARLCLFHQYLRQAPAVCELGCGSCANLLLLSNILPGIELIGLDWTKASTKIAGALSYKVPSRISGHVFDMLSPDLSLKLPRGAALITIHAFEQLGSGFEPVLDFMLRVKPSIVVQYEPVLDFYAKDILVDHLALDYCTKRNYLNGYYARLKALERDGRIQILAAYRPHLGGVFHEASVLVWRPFWREE